MKDEDKTYENETVIDFKQAQTVDIEMDGGNFSKDKS